MCKIHRIPSENTIGGLSSVMESFWGLRNEITGNCCILKTLNQTEQTQ